jgi:thiol-disulfide isomerase/thioredoxin
LAAYKGKVVLLDFCATWSEACRAEVPDLNRMRADLVGRGFEIVALSLDKGGVATDLHNDYPAQAANEETRAAFGDVRVIPTKILVDRDGKERKRFQGVTAPAEIRSEAEALLAEQ